MKNTEVGYQAHFANAESELAEQNTHHSAMTLPIPRTESPKAKRGNTRNAGSHVTARTGVTHEPQRIHTLLTGGSFFAASLHSSSCAARGTGSATRA